MNKNPLHSELRYALSLTSPSSVFGREALKELRPFDNTAALNTELDYVAALMSALDKSPSLVQEACTAIAPFKDVRRSVRECGERALSLLEAFEIKCFLLQYETALKPLRQIKEQYGLKELEFCEAAPALALIDPTGERAPSFSLGAKLIDGIAAVREQKSALEKRIAHGETELFDERARLVSAETKLEKKALAELSENLAPLCGALLSSIDSIARLDLLIEKALLAKKYDCARPEIVLGKAAFTDAINPRIAAKVASFTPITAELLTGCTVITGANMGGKTVALRTLALNVMLVNCGFFPFASHAECALFDEVLLILGDKQDDERGLSSFGGEVEELKKLAAKLESGRCFAAVDEPAKGTNAREGAALATAVCGYLNRRDSVCVITTHYDGVAGEGRAHYRVAGLDADIKKESSEDGAERFAHSMRYGLTQVGRGEKCPDSALAVCRALGLAEEITDKAQQLLDERI